MIRDFEAADAPAAARVALEAWAEFERVFDGWDALAGRLAAIGSLAQELELIVALEEGTLAGLIGYAPPGAKRDPMFRPEWAIVRLLSVAPSARARGIGRRLTEECIVRARRDGAPAIALHTSPAMQVALPLYERLGFVRERAIPDRFGVPYALYTLAL